MGEVAADSRRHLVTDRALRRDVESIASILNVCPSFQRQSAAIRARPRVRLRPKPCAPRFELMQKPRSEREKRVKILANGFVLQPRTLVYLKNNAI